ncbi:MAG: ATP-binding protein, partial [Desulfobacterales bacterium]|nr:ATP-binding protein [Desulfobacterales bacterium]
SLLNQQLKLKGIRVDIRAPKPPVTIRGSWNQLEQVLVNLITNARDAVLDNGPDKDKFILISAEPDASGRHLDIIVKDTGNGISPEHRDFLFDPFFTTKPVDKGTGLGLSISYGIIEEHDGALELLDSGPEGTTFRIRLPITEVQDDRQ